VDGLRARYRVPYPAVGSEFGEPEMAAIAEVLRSAETLSCGPRRDRFEEDFRALVGTRHALSLSSCTSALQIATHLIGLEPGDEVIATPQTYQATISMLLEMEVTVRFCDIDPDTLNLDPQRLPELVTPRTRAIYLLHYGGLCADMDPIMALAERHGLVVVEDCAHALGARYLGRSAGSLGHIGCFSFQSSKNISTLGQGGMIAFDRDDWAETVRRIRAIEPDADFVPARPRFGPYREPRRPLNQHEKNAFTHDCTALRAGGTNSTLGEVAAAVGSVQLGRLAELNRRRQQITDALDEGLSTLPGIRVRPTPPGHESACHLYTFFAAPDAGPSREAIAWALEDLGVEMQLRYFPLHLLPEWRRRGGGFGQCPIAERLWFEEHLNLPCYPQLTDAQVAYMVEAVGTAIGRAREHPATLTAGTVARRRHG
jgi:perosamine synthetase